MRIDFQQDEHLRVGRVLITWHPDVAHHRPGLHEVGMGETRADARKVEKVARLAEVLLSESFDRQPANQVRGEVELVPVPFLERLGEALTDWHLSVEHERFGGIGVPIRGRLICVGWKDARPPRVDRLRWSEVKRRRAAKLRRLLDTSPQTTGGIAVMDAEGEAVPAGPSTPFLFDRGTR